MREAEKLLKERGTAPRLHRNALAFLAADATLLADVKNRVRTRMARRNVWENRASLNLDEFQKRTAETRKGEADRMMEAQLAECWQWLLAPEQPVSTDPTLVWPPLRLTGADPLPLRAVKKLNAEEKVICIFGRQRLSDTMVRFGLWGDGPHLVAPIHPDCRCAASADSNAVGVFRLLFLSAASVLAEAMTKGLDLAANALGLRRRGDRRWLLCRFSVFRRSGRGERAKRPGNARDRAPRIAHRRVFCQPSIGRT